MTQIQRRIFLWTIIIIEGLLTMVFGINYYITHDIIWSMVVTTFVAGVGIIGIYISKMQGRVPCRQQTK